MTTVSQALKRITITVVAADGLSKRDVFRLPDPFVVINVDSEQTYTTSVVKKTLNPYWNETFDFIVNDTSVISVRIFDQRKFNHKDQGFLGVVNVHISDIDLEDLKRGEYEMLTLDLKPTNPLVGVNGKLTLHFYNNDPQPISPQASSYTIISDNMCSYGGPTLPAFWDEKWTVEDYADDDDDTCASPRGRAKSIGISSRISSIADEATEISCKSGSSSLNEGTQQQPPHWSARLFDILPSTLNEHGVLFPSSSSPFPRYGHTLTVTSTLAGDLHFFGGVVDESVTNDLYCFNVRNFSASLVQTIGDIPSPRIGHASAMIGNVLIVWGGDTNAANPNAKARQDGGLYLLNLVSREWTRVLADGPTPAGRYGHAVAMAQTSRFIVFGGQVDGEFLNDLWSFDLNSLRSTPTWELVESTSLERPAKRTGHVCVGYGDRVIVFGGTDGQYHYNDTWAFDFKSRKWSELECIGFIPEPREGHAVALVDDVMYIFGGHGVDGKDFGDLAALKVSNLRWYMFPKMGLAPSGRSGHAMASVGTKVFVLGGDSFPPSRSDNLNHVYVLDTSRIKYISDKKPAVISLQSDSTPDISDDETHTIHIQQTEAKTLLSQLEAILHDKNKYQILVSQRGTLAQSLLDLLQMLSISPEISPPLRSSVLKALLRLSRQSNLYPQCLTIGNVKQLEGHPVDSGGFGEIWKGAVEGSQEIVCLKVVKLYQKSDVEKVLKKFLQEAIIWRQLEHPNLLPFLGLYFLDEGQQRLCLISPWMERGNLIQFLEQTPRKDVNHRQLVWDVANGLKYLHQRKIIHADLKGVNVLITKYGRATVGDFGLSYVADGEVLRMTSSSAFSGGTTRWLAPELLGSGLRPSYKSDIYAFGLVCYEIYTGLRPFHHLRYDAAVVLPVLQGTRPSRPENTPELDDDMWALVEGCWAAEASSRPDIGSVVDTLVPLRGPIDSAPTWNSTVSKHIWVNAQGASHNQEAVTFLSQLYGKLHVRNPSQRPLPPTPGQGASTSFLKRPRPEFPGRFTMG